MTVYQFQLSKGACGGKLITFETDFKHSVHINPKAVMKIESLATMDDIEGTYCEGRIGATDGSWQIATLWDGTKYVINMMDAFEIRQNYWKEKLW